LNEIIKKKDKEINEFKKLLLIKSEALDKAKRENDEISNILNTNQYKSIRMLEVK